MISYVSKFKQFWLEFLDFGWNNKQPRTYPFSFKSDNQVLFDVTFFSSRGILCFNCEETSDCGQPHVAVLLSLSCRYTGYIEDITRRREDMNFTIFYERAQRVSKILFLTRENQIHIFKPPCNVLFII